MTDVLENTEKHGPIHAAIEDVWGPRCSDFEPECRCCKVWAEYDRLRAALELDKPRAAWAKAVAGQQKLMAEIERLNAQIIALNTHIETQRAKIESLRAATQWRPISTAPKDGTWFVIVNEDDGADNFEVGCYDPATGYDFEPVADGLFRKTAKVIYEWRGFNNMHRATHWLPLPPPPAINKEGGE